MLALVDSAGTNLLPHRRTHCPLSVTIHLQGRLLSTEISATMDGLQLRDEAVQDRIRAATDFLDPTDPRARSYRSDIILMLNRGLRRLVVSIDEIRAHSRELADGLLKAPFDYSPAFDEALKRVVRTLPNRPTRETNDDTVSAANLRAMFGC